MEGESKCNCQRCGQPIGFPLDLHNTEITCPHCGRATTGALPRVRALPPEPAHYPPAIAAPAPAGNANNFMALGFILALIFPLGGLAIGISQLARGFVGLGLATILASFLLAFMWVLFLSGM